MLQLKLVKSLASNKEELFIYYAPLVIFYTPVVTKYVTSVAVPASTVAKAPS